MVDWTDDLRYLMDQGCVKGGNVYGVGDQECVWAGI